MSRFAGAFNFAGGDESSSDGDQSDQGDSQTNEAAPAQTQKVSKYFMDSDDDAEEERHFKTGDIKKWESLEKILEDCRKHANISDFSAME